MQVRHCTSLEALDGIVQGSLWAGSWVTSANVEDLTRDQRVKALEFNDDRKGQCACKLEIKRSDLTVPKEGQLTSAGYPQFRTRRPVQVTKSACKCDTEAPWGAVALIGFILLGALWLRNRSHYHDLRQPSCTPSAP